MKKSRSLSLVMCLLISGMSLAQRPTHEQYVKDGPTDVQWYEAYRTWKPGTSLYSNYDDEEFFISRVKPKKRFTNKDAQAKPDLNPERKLLWWCPIGTSGWNAIPNYYFDSEVFSMWSYVDIYGNWTAPFIRMPGAFADICHKNGVQTSVLASVPWASTITSTDNGHGSNMKAMLDGGSDKLLEFLRYYGIDGIGYNSEFNIGSGLSATELKNLLGDCFAKARAKDGKWPTFTNAWYSLMTNGGSLGGGLQLNSANIDWFDYNGKPTSDAYFMNYGFGNGTLGESQTSAKNKGRSSFDVYAGINYQGSSHEQWPALNNYEISVGLWGAHDMNMIFEGRGELGGSPLVKQQAYQLRSENSFTGSSYNPINTPPISNLLSCSSQQTKFHGFSSFIAERSALSTDDLGKEPFVTYFNLGNGMFFNVEGKKQYPNQWYNIGMQDYLPTWRWWWTSSFMGRSATDVPAKGLAAEFTWDDAWFGGSCLAISGQTDAEYLHLFKTKYSLMTNDKLFIRYKVLKGSGSLKWACSAEGAETLEVSANVDTKLAPTEEGEWQEKTVIVGPARANLKLAGKTMAVMGLKFENTTSDFKVLIGEVSLVRNTAPTPNAPVITKSAVLKANYLGVDAKVIFKMKDRSATNPEEPIYNSDVDAWFYKVYTQQEGEDAIMATATTSWAAYVVSSPYKSEKVKKVRIGVSAVSVDGKSESPITWSEYMAISDLAVEEGIEINKSVIKPNEEFVVKYKDPYHPTANWTIISSLTGEVVGEPVLDSQSITTQLPTVGLYDLKLQEADTTIVYKGLIQISGDVVGAVPQINALKANDGDNSLKTSIDTPVKMSYVGRPADGTVSRGLLLTEKAFGIECEQLGFSSSTPFTISFWFNPARFNHGSGGTQLVNIRSLQTPWPAGDWGYIWSEIAPNNEYSISLRKGRENGGWGATAKDFVFQPNQWYHYALVMDYKDGRSYYVYLNGKKVAEYTNITDIYAWTNSNAILVGGKAFSRAGLDGFLDEFQLYNKALTQDEVLKSMEHQTTIPESLIGYWDFESDPNAEDGFLYSTGTNKNLKAATVEIVSAASEGGSSQFGNVGSKFATGAPFIAGTNYQITTTPTWSTAKAATISDATGNSNAGQANVSYSKTGIYDVKLTLTNDWGSDSKTFSFIEVAVGSGIQDHEIEAAYNAYPNPFIDNVMIRFANGGTYDIEVFDIAGKLTHVEKATVAAGEHANLAVNGSAGTYFINIKKDGKTLKALKVIKK